MSIRYLQIGLEEDPVAGGAGPLSLRFEQLIPENHEFLMNFIDYDLSHVELPLEEYLACLDTGRDARKQLLVSAVTELQKMHPYFMVCRENAAKLLNQCFADHVRIRFPSLGEQEQKALFLKVAVTDYSFYAAPDRFFTPYLLSDGEHILDRLYTLQEGLRKWIFLTIDNTSPALAALSAKERSVLYAHIACRDMDFPQLHLRTEYSTRSTPRMLKRLPPWDFGQGEDAGADAIPLKEHYNLLGQELDALMQDPAGEIPPLMQDVIDAAAGNSEDCDVITYYIRSFANLLELEVYQMVHADLRMKRCKNCGRYFIVDKSNQEYCQRLAPGSAKPCTEVGRARVYGRKITRDITPTGLYRKAYKTHYARVARGQMSREAFEKWKTEALEMRDRVNTGRMELSDFSAYLNQ